MDTLTATTPSPVCGISATSETQKQSDRLMNAEPAWTLPAADAPSPKTVSDRSDTVTNSKPIRTPAAAAAAMKYPVNSAGTPRASRRLSLRRGRSGGRTTGSAVKAQATQNSRLLMPLPAAPWPPSKRDAV